MAARGDALDGIVAAVGSGQPCDLSRELYSFGWWLDGACGGTAGAAACSGTHYPARRQYPGSGEARTIPLPPLGLAYFDIPSGNGCAWTEPVLADADAVTYGTGTAPGSAIVTACDAPPFPTVGMPGLGYSLVAARGRSSLSAITISLRSYDPDGCSDGGLIVAGPAGGCGCRVGRRAPASGAIAVLAILALAGARRRGGRART
jgi:MYXO-CTERM domain-containing protein